MFSYKWIIRVRYSIWADSIENLDLKNARGFILCAQGKESNQTRTKEDGEK